MEARMVAGRFPNRMMTAGLIAGLMSGGFARADDVVTISGKAIFKGDATEFDPAPIAEAKGTQCDNGQIVLSDRVLINKHTSPTTLRNVLVWLAEGPVDMRAMAPKEAVTIDMVGCRFEPRISTAFIRQRVLVQNEDRIPHTFRTLPEKNKPQGVSIPKRNMPISLSFFDTEPPFEIQSIEYPWMRGWIALFDQPYFLMTDERGTFEFKDFPAGKYTFKAWHEVFGTKTIQIDVSPGKENTLDFVFAPEKKESAKTEKN